MKQIIKNFVLMFFGSSDYGFQVFGEQSREILSNDELSSQLLNAIDMDKRGENPPTLEINQKQYKLVRLHETQIPV